MIERIESTPELPVEGALRALYSTAPEPGFVAGLERRLLAQARTMPAYRGEELCHKAHQDSSARPSRRFVSSVVQTPRRRWALGALALVLVLSSAVLAVGPQEVWAQVQRLLGYVPGVGFVDLDAARVLAAPVSVTREGVTLYVEQAIARPDGTTITIRAEGLPSVVPAEPGEAPALRLPDGSVLAHRGYELRYGQGKIEFPPLPEGVDRATLVLPRLPLVPAGAAPGGWEVPLVLRAATGELAAALFPQPYRPQVADTHEGVTVRVLDVAQSAEETALRLELEWEDPSAYVSSIASSVYLRDDLGHVYSVSGRPGNGSFVETEVIAIDPAAPRPTPAPATREETVGFGPVSPQARELTLLLREILFSMPVDARLSIDLGDHPQIGDSWPLEADLQVAGVPVRVVGARLVEQIVDTRQGPERRIALEFDVVPGAGRGGRSLTSLSLDYGAVGFSGATGRSGGSGRLTAAVFMAEGEPLPRGRVEVRVREAMVTLPGPWTVTWPVPGAASDNAAPAVLHPQASQRAGDLTLCVDEAVLSDRLTRVRLVLADAPAGVAFSGMDSFAAIAPGQGATLRDDRGRDYGLPNSLGVRWLPGGMVGPELDTLTFAPLEPLAQRLTLRLPGVRVAWPGAAAFDVEVPAGLALAPAGDGRRGLVSAPWAVDIPVEVAGYSLRFAQAQLEEGNGTTMLRLTSVPYTPGQKDRWLAGLRVAAIEGPAGRAVDVARAFSTFSAAGPLGEGRSEHQAMLLFDVAGPDGAVQPGRYHVALSGATVAVQGPWELSWQVVGR